MERVVPSGLRESTSTGMTRPSANGAGRAGMGRDVPSARRASIGMVGEIVAFGAARQARVRGALSVRRGGMSGKVC